MRAKKTLTALSAACISFAVAIGANAQDDLDALLDIDTPAKKADAAKPGDKKPEAQKPEVAKPAVEAPKPEVKKEDAKPADKKADAAPEVKPAPEAKPEEKKEDAKPADKKADAAPEVKPAPEAKPEEKKEDAKPADKKADAAPEVKPAEEVKPEEKKEDVKPADKKADAEPEVKPAEEVKPEEKKEDVKPADKKADAEPEVKPAEEVKPEEKKEDVKADDKKADAEPEVKPADEAKPEEKKEDVKADDKKADAEPEVKPPDEAKPAKEKKVVNPDDNKDDAKPEVEPADPPHPDAELISDLMAVEKLRRDSLDVQANREIDKARKASEQRDWEEMFKQYQHAFSHLSDREGSRELKREAATGMAEAKYQGGKQALRENDVEKAKKLLDEALKLHHPLAKALIDSIDSKDNQDNATDISDIEHVRNNKKYKESRDLYLKRLRLAAQYLAVSDLVNALDQCELVLREDPSNEQAIALRDRIQHKRHMIMVKEREATRKGMIADVDQAWRPVYAINSIELKGIDSGTTKKPIAGNDERSIEQNIEKRMKEMILPQIQFRPPATIIDVVDFFRQASKDYDRPEIPAEQRGFNFVLQLDKQLNAAGGAAAAKKDDNAFAAAGEDDNAAAAGDVPQIPNISASNISLYEALKLVCKISNFKFKVQGSVIMVMPKSMTTEELVTRTYSVVESFLDRVNEASSGLKKEKAGEFGGGDENAAGGDADENQWKTYFEEMGVSWPQNSKIKYLKAVGKLRVTNTEDQLAIFEDALNELNVTPSMIEIETRFVEVAQEDLNSLGFEWLLNSDYSFKVGGKLKKVLNLKDGSAEDTSGWILADGQRTVNDTYTSTSSSTGGVVGGGTYTTNRKWDSSSTITDTADQTYAWSRGSGWVRDEFKTGRNMLINSMDGDTYGGTQRFLSQEGNHISGEGTQNNDRLMRFNAFLGDADVSMILHMLSQRNDTDLLSAPKVVTKSGQEATIKVVTIYRFPQDYDVTIQSTSSSGGGYYSSGGSSGKILPMVEPQNFETQEVGVILTVTPELSPEGLINLALTPKVISEPEWRDYGMRVPMDAVMGDSNMLVQGANGLADAVAKIGQDKTEKIEWFTVPMEQPFFKERSIDTHVTLYNGATIVMGGLITEQRKAMEDKIPFLGDIPFIGRLFRSRSEWSNKRNLLLFVTARLVDPNGRQIIQNTTEKDAGEKDAKAVTPAPAAN